MMTFSSLCLQRINSLFHGKSFFNTNKAMPLPTVSMQTGALIYISKHRFSGAPRQAAVRVCGALDRCLLEAAPTVDHTSVRVCHQGVAARPDDGGVGEAGVCRRAGDAARGSAEERSANLHTQREIGAHEEAGRVQHHTRGDHHDAAVGMVAAVHDSFGQHGRGVGAVRRGVRELAHVADLRVREDRGAGDRLLHDVLHERPWSGGSGRQQRPEHGGERGGAEHDEPGPARLGGA